MTTSSNNLENQGKKRRTYWLIDYVTDRHRDRAALLAEKGFEVAFCTTIEQFQAEIQVKRAGIVLMSDSGPENKVRAMVNTLVTMPEIAGARLILVVEKSTPFILGRAAGGNFRDMIPFDIDDQGWINRFLFATASRAIAFPKPVGQITVNSIAALRLPARVVWISPRHMWFESRMQAPVGTVLTLEGPLAGAMGLETISITVESNVRKNLMYRFSDATIASWSVPAVANNHASQLLERLKIANTGPRCRIFMAIQSQKLRTALMKAFDQPKFEIGAALQKQGLINEPKFFNPHVVFVEDVVATEQSAAIDEMLTSLSPHAAVMIVGKFYGLDALRSRHPGRRLAVLKELPRHLPEMILKKYTPLLSTTHEGIDADANFLTSDQEMSFAEISLPARLTGLHTLAGEIAVPVSIGNFALAQLDSPFVRKAIGRNPWIKFVSVRQETQPGATHLTCSGEFLHADALSIDRDKIAKLMLETLSETLGRSLPGPKTDGQSMSTPYASARSPDTRFPGMNNKNSGAVLLASPSVSSAAPAVGAYSSPQKSEPRSGRPLDAVAAVKVDLGEENDGTPAIPMHGGTNAPTTLRTGTATQIAIQTQLQNEGGFVAKMTPIFAEAAVRDEAETERLVKKITVGARKKRTAQAIGFLVALLFFVMIVSIIRMSSNEDPATQGKVWSDSFKAFKDLESGKRGSSSP